LLGVYISALIARYSFSILKIADLSKIRDFFEA
jgi:hypothetical protein